MVTKQRILLLALLMTSLLFSTIYFSNVMLNRQRESAILNQMGTFVGNYEEMQTLTMMSDVFGQEVTCLSMQARIRSMDKELWDTGLKIDQYRAVTEQFMTDPFYIEQKRRFNNNEIMYFSLVKQMKEWCDVNQTTILYFYKKKEECPDCDAQSFVLTDIKKEVKGSISIFSFDADLDLAPVQILATYYNLSNYPCTVIEDISYCGLFNKDRLLEMIAQAEGSAPQAQKK
ncbi:hypothetical protein HZA99_03470 [Candidatus Woesearchaeota archaeon]|nr:hypothetical protein [Candidatus Woesearchaeota archaeon]